MKVSPETSERLVSYLPHEIPWTRDECENSNVWEERARGAFWTKPQPIRSDQGV